MNSNLMNDSFERNHEANEVEFMNIQYNHTPMNNHLNLENKDDIKHRNSNMKYLIVLMMFFGIFAFIMLNYTVNGYYFTLYQDYFIESSSISDEYNVVYSNASFGMNRVGYDVITLNNKPLSYNFLSSYTTIIEPYVESKLWLSNVDKSLYYRYSLCLVEDSSQCYEGIYSQSDEIQSVNVIAQCKPYDEFVISYSSYSIEDDSIIETNTAKALCIYVRREIRSLSTLDLQKTLDTMHKLWTTDTESGKQEFGENFVSAAFLTNLHHFNAAWQDSDHIHEGNGFLLQHIKLSNMFEVAMQSVDPSVSLPYWDYTIEHSQGQTPINSFIMTAEVFGSMQLPTDLSYGFTYKSDNILSGAIPDGRWANLKVDINDLYPDLKFGYGYMRGSLSISISMQIFDEYSYFLLIQRHGI